MCQWCDIRFFGGSNHYRMGKHPFYIYIFAKKHTVILPKNGKKPRFSRGFLWLYLFIASLWRREWDSNPREIALKRFSRPPRYDHFDIPPYMKLRLRRNHRIIKFSEIFLEMRFCVVSKAHGKSVFTRFFDLFATALIANFQDSCPSENIVAERCSIHSLLRLLILVTRSKKRYSIVFCTLTRYDHFDMPHIVVFQSNTYIIPQKIILSSYFLL